MQPTPRPSASMFALAKAAKNVGDKRKKDLAEIDAALKEGFGDFEQRAALQKRRDDLANAPYSKENIMGRIKAASEQQEIRNAEATKANIQKAERYSKLRMDQMKKRK